MTEELYEQMYEELESSISYHQRSNTDTWCKVFTIFGKYDKDDRITVCGYHDKIFVGPCDAPDDFEIEEEDAKFLVSAGWLFGEYGWKKFT